MNSLEDKLAEWFESYAKLLELNVWTQTNLTSAKWNADKRQWTVDLERKKADGTTENRTLHPRHVVSMLRDSFCILADLAVSNLKRAY